MESKFDKFIISLYKIWEFTNFKYHFLILSLLSFLYLDLFQYVAFGFWKSFFGFLIIVPIFFLLLYFLMVVIPLYFQVRRKLFAFMVFLIPISFLILIKQTDNLFLSLLKDLALVPLIFSCGYIFIVSVIEQPDESYPTFKKLFRRLKFW